MPTQETEITETGGVQITVTDDSGATRSVTLDPNLEDDLRLSALSDGGFEVEFPDGSGGRLVLQFVPDIANTSLILKGGRPDGTLLTTTVTLS